MTSSRTKSFFAALIIMIAFFSGNSHALASGEWVQIQAVSPLGAIDPGTSVSFNTMANGFIDPKYAFSDAFSATGATTGTIDKIGTFTWTPGVYDAGRHTITVTVTDDSAHAASSTVNILVASNNVLVSAISPAATIAAGRTVSFTMTAPGFINPRYAVYDANSMSSANTNGTIDSSGKFSWTPLTGEAGDHTLTVRASDLYGHSALSTVHILVVNPSVSIQSLQPGSGAGVGSPVSFTAKALSLATTTYTLTDLFTGSSTLATTTSTSGNFTWTASSSDLGIHTLTVVASDLSGNAATTTFQVAITNAPAIVTTPAASVVGVTSTAVTAAPAKRYAFTAALGIGSKGAAVTELQNRLISLGFLSGTATGYYGALTAAAVKRFQKANGLAQVGSVGPGTRAALNK